MLASNVMGVNDIREQWCFPLCRPISLIDRRMRIKILSPFQKILLMSTKRGMRLPEAKGFLESTVVRKWQRYMDEVKKCEDSRLPLVGECMRQTVACNRVTRSSVRGMPRPRVSCARGGTR